MKVMQNHIVTLISWNSDNYFVLCKTVKRKVKKVFDRITHNEVQIE